MSVDVVSTLSFICIVVIIILSIIIRFSVKEPKEKREAEAAIVMAILILLGFISSYTNATNLKEQNEILSKQYNHLEQQSNYKSKMTDSLEQLVISCLALKDSIQLFTALNKKVIQGNDGKSLIINNVSKAATDTTFNVNSVTNTNIRLTSGDQVFISASGSIKLGQFVGVSGPNGRESGVFGLGLSSYSIVENINHGALIYKYSDDGDWTFCGDAYKFKAVHSGTLYFNVNDNDQGNNIGYYKVNVKIYTKPL